MPGDDTRKLRKAAQLRCDFIALDCEDGVAVSRKQEARNTIRAFYDSNLNEVPSKFDRNQRQSEWSVRLNGWSSGLCEDDLRVVVAGRRVPETLLLPKCESAAELQAVSGGSVCVCVCDGIARIAGGELEKGWMSHIKWVECHCFGVILAKAQVITLCRG